MFTTAPYGTWDSPITADAILSDDVRLADPLVAGEFVYWVEGRPSEGGRCVIVRRSPEGVCRDVIAEPYSARTLVHEYGGLAYAVHDGYVYFANMSDQRLYRVAPGTALGTEPATASDAEPEALTGEPVEARSVRFAAPVVSPDGRSIYCVRERHLSDSVVNDIVVLDAGGPSEPRTVAGGHDFFSFPTVSPDGTHLAWTSWDHPCMPWDGTELWEAKLGPGGLPSAARLVAGGREESITQPRYSPDGRLHFISDRTGWWNIYVDDEISGTAVCPADADFAEPDWQFGFSSYDFIRDGSLIVSWLTGGLWNLGVVRAGETTPIAVTTSWTRFAFVRSGAGASTHADGGSVVLLGGSPSDAPTLAQIDLDTGDVTSYRVSQARIAGAEYLTQVESIDFPTEGGKTAHALFYRPNNPAFRAPKGELPPLVVISHGGPTSMADSVLNYRLQYFTSRGFALVDVNYGGSSGYGREYRDRMQGKWGVVDLDDCVNVAKYLAEAGLVDGSRMTIRGASAGGYTTLCALTFRDVFAAGASHFGVADLGILARHAHKFEARYMDKLVGPWPEAEEIYEQRSPIFHTDQMRTPTILFQGLEDRVVPPEQSEMMAKALRDKGIPFSYLAFGGEGHGFRKAENLKRALEAEMYFYGKVLGFVPAGDLEEVEIENAEALGVA